MITLTHNINKIQNVPAFKAKQYGDKVYSNWFVDRVDSFVKSLPKDEQDKRIEQDVKIYKALYSERHPIQTCIYSPMLNNSLAQREKDYYDLRKTIKAEKIAMANYEADKKAEEANNDLIYCNRKNEIMNNDIKPIFLDRLQLAMGGKKVILPNCIMLEGNNRQANDEIIDWTINEAIKRGSNYEEIKPKEDICDETYDVIDMIEKIEESGKRTILKVKNFEDLINPEKNDLSEIAELKKVMQKLSSEYNTTLIFSTSNTSKLEKAAVQEGRVTKVDTTIEMPESKLIKPEFVHGEIKDDALDSKLLTKPKEWTQETYDKCAIGENTSKAEYLIKNPPTPPHDDDNDSGDDEMDIVMWMNYYC